MTRWHQVIALGIQEVRRRLAQLGIAVAAGLRYFGLCSLLYRATARMSQSINNVVNTAELRIAQAQSVIDRLEGHNETEEETVALIEARSRIAQLQLQQIMDSI